MTNEITKVAIIGLGYVGLPLAIACSYKYEVVGYDKNKDRIDQLKMGSDITGEFVTKELLRQTVEYVESVDQIANADIVIVTVPTPVTDDYLPDLNPLISACNEISPYLKKNATIVFESTVYPGVTEEICVPIIEKNNKWKLNDDFYVGYSPERINPGDKINTVTTIRKLTSGSNQYAATLVDTFYKSIITAGTHLCQTIKIAEAAKVVENTQRDVNIAFVNELSMIFDAMEIETHKVLEAAGTKWNFMNFKPGLVGGHCIGIDPYYMINKAQKIGIQPKIMVSSREVNERLPIYVADRLIKDLVKKKKDFENVRVMVLGITFKENCPDTRNSKVFDLIKRLKEYHINVDTYDSILQEDNAINFKYIYDAIIFAVPHTKMVENFENGYFKKIINHDTIIYDLKAALSTTTDFKL